MTVRAGEDEALPPRYSLVERERRFLVDPALLPPLGADHVLIEDRYLDDTRLRLRSMTDSATGEVTLKLAKKYEAADPAARPMVNAYLTAAEHAVFATLPARTIVKRRYRSTVAGDVFAIDVFGGALAGLLLAEIEAGSCAALVVISHPPWAIREVTTDRRFQGGSLARLDAAGLGDLLCAVTAFR